MIVIVGEMVSWSSTVLIRPVVPVFQYMLHHFNHGKKPKDFVAFKLLKLCDVEYPISHGTWLLLPLYYIIQPN